MKKELSKQTIIGVIAAVVVVLGIIGWIYFKPHDDVAKPHLQQLGGARQNRLQMMNHAANPPGGQ